MVLSAAYSFFPKILKGVNYLFHSCVVPYDCEIGEGSKFLYGGLGTVVVRNAKIGKHVLIGTNVTIGGRSNKPGAPVIGNNVYIATGSKVLGEVTISDNRYYWSKRSGHPMTLPSNCSVAGVPARIIKGKY